MMRTIPIESAGHPLRNAIRRNAARDIRKRVRARARDDDDFKMFALSYTAFFVCFYTFIA